MLHRVLENLPGSAFLSESLTGHNESKFSQEVAEDHVFQQSTNQTLCKFL